ncbi:glycosyl hydrolase family 8 [Aureimonas glaciei]|uniref:Glucanase n=1 Tax=Aureimonas glaciei TaxID=1776957 RepID=A0A917DKH4_9HYPH|nr:glycosyl hydrolase family 8 [Aureimonas glaciei]GGD44072.1 endoglucanase [Aureimonas glaciei]
MTWRTTLVVGVLSALLAGTQPGRAQSTVGAEDWAAYKRAFVTAEGRIVDDGNGNISHSEGQGYGLLLAYLAGDAPQFDLIWSFTRTELLLRDDGLAAWKWDPAATPHVTDSNNASDGDILIAYALGLAGRDWKRAELTRAAGEIATALSRVIREEEGQKILLPGATGYGRDDRPDGPIINLSYWVFEAFPLFATIAPDIDWETLSRDGVALLGRSLLGPSRLPPEWLSIRTRLRPAEGFPAEFGYNALRIPLYLVRAGSTDAAMLTALRDGMSPVPGQVAIVDIASGATKESLADPGYAIIPALVSCVLDKTPIAEPLRSFTPTLYFPSTLHLLSLSYLAEHHPECLT